MKTIELMRLAFAALAANKLRAALTMLGITVGIFSVIVVMTAISAISASVENGLNVLGANSFQVSKYPPINFGPPDNRFANRRDIEFPMARRFRDLMEADGGTVSLMIRRGGREVSYLDRRTNPNNILGGADENFAPARNYTVAQGRNLGREDVDFGRPVAVIGTDLVKKLFFDQSPIDRQIRIDGQTYTVVGVFEEKGSSFGASQDNFVIVPITRWLQIYGRAGRSISINVAAPSPDAVAPLQDRAIGAMRIVRGLDPEEPNDFEVFSNDSLIRSFNEVSSVIAAGAFVISAIALAAAGVGIMNIMLVSVTERTKEIGIRKSLGARQSVILRQFLVEAAVIAFLGGIVGVGAGISGGNLVGLALGVGTVFPWGWAVTGLVVCAGIGIVFGYYPALKAARLDPIEALRYE